MSEVAALYTYPIKGFSPHSVESVKLTSDNRLEGDRVWSLRFPAGVRAEERDGLDYWPKGNGVCVRDHPRLPQLKTTVSGQEYTLRFPGGDARIYALPRHAREFEDDVSQFLRLDEPVTLTGDGHTPRFQDRPAGFVSVHFRSSLRHVEETLGAQVDERRFRSNIAIEGTRAWAEQELIRETVHIGQVAFTVHAPIVRCLAINACPEKGELDLRVLQSLRATKATFGVLLLPHLGQAGKTLHLGDEFWVG